MFSIYINQSSFLHNVPDGHPERVNRYYVLKEMINEKFSKYIKNVPLINGIEEIISINHSYDYIKNIKSKIPNEGFHQLDPDTYLSKKSLDAAYMGVSTSIEALKDVITGNTRRAFVCTRPPGHHSEPNKAMGFCIFSNAAIIAKYAQQKYNLKKIVVLDFDIHHGNGTQESFLHFKDLYLFSSHEMPLYPGTGDSIDKGLGNIFNFPIDPYCSSQKFLNLWKNNILNKVKKLNPDLVILSSGFDAHKDDNISTAQLVSQDYKILTKEIVKISNEICEGKIISLLEGGYNLKALKESVYEHLFELNQNFT